MGCLMECHESLSMYRTKIIAIESANNENIIIKKWVTGMGKSRLASHYMPFLHDTFWHFSTLFGDNR
jgi:hypothetical protein